MILFPTLLLKRVRSGFSVVKRQTKTWAFYISSILSIYALVAAEWYNQRTLTLGSSITVGWSQVWLVRIKPLNHIILGFSRIQSSQTRDQLFSDTSPHVECSLAYTKVYKGSFTQTSAICILSEGGNRVKTQCKNARANRSQIDDVYLFLANKQEFELLFMQKPIFYSHLVQEALPTSDYWLILSVTRCLYYLFNIRPFTTVKLTQWHALFVKID